MAKNKSRAGAGHTGPAGTRFARAERVSIASKRQTPQDEGAGLLCVYDGQICIGFLMRRGREGVAAYDSDNHLIGLFPDQTSAAAAIERGRR
jgi:hypothetical protein